MKKILNWNFFTYLFFIIYFIIGLSIYKDFGVGIEEHFQRQKVWMEVLYEIKSEGKNFSTKRYCTKSLPVPSQLQLLKRENKTLKEKLLSSNNDDGATNAKKKVSKEERMESLLEKYKILKLFYQSVLIE